MEGEHNRELSENPKIQQEPVIPEIPKLPDEIKNAVRGYDEVNRLVIFIGAGVSRLYGLPSWLDMSKSLLQKIYEDNKIFTYKEKETLEALTNPKRILSYCYEKLKDTHKENLFFDVLKNILTVDKSKSDNVNIYNNLKALRGFYLTTNIDVIFNEQFTSYVCGENLSNDEILQSNILYQLHGSINELNTIILTEDKYLSLYKLNDQYRDFLNKIFNSDKVVLFVGYSMTELELLQYLIYNNPHGKPAENNGNNFKRFILNGYYQSDEINLKIDESYYSRLGIKVVPYAKDKIGFQQLEIVIADWAKQIVGRSSFVDDIMRRIETEVDSYNG